MSTSKTLLSAEELFALPDDGLRHELVRGELRTMTPAGSEHGAIVARLGRRLAALVEERELGLAFGAETGFQLQTDPDTIRAPDAAFVRRERVPATGIPQGYWPGAPDLAVEVISPSDAYTEVEEKVLEWLQHGAELVWVINPRTRTVTTHSRSQGLRLLSADEELTGGSVLPGFTCPVAELFP